MKAILVTSNDEVSIVDITEPLHRSVRELVGGHIEIVRPINMKRPFVMICNEDYCELNLPFNFMGSYFYGTQIHKHPVLGNIVIMKEEGPELVGLSDIECRTIIEICNCMQTAVKIFKNPAKGGTT